MSVYTAHWHYTVYNLSFMQMPSFSGTSQGQRAPVRGGRQSRQAEHGPQTLPLLHIISVFLATPAPPQTCTSLSPPNAVQLLSHPAASPPITGDHPQVRGQRAEREADAPASPSLPSLSLATPILTTSA